MDNGKHPIGIQMWVGVSIGLRTVGGPASMAYTYAMTDVKRFFLFQKLYTVFVGAAGIFINN